MQHHHDRISQLLAKYIQDTLDPDEKAELDEWISSSPSNAGFLDRLKAPGTLEGAFDFFSGVDPAHAWEKISQKIALPEEQPLRPGYRKYWWYAAAVLLFFGTWRTLLTYNNKSTGVALETAGRDFSPGSDKAVLLLNKETRLVLEDFADGIIYRENNLSIEKRDGILRYHLSAGPGSAPEHSHTLYTPVGGQFAQATCRLENNVPVNDPVVFIDKDRDTDPVLLYADFNPSKLIGFRSTDTSRRRPERCGLSIFDAYRRYKIIPLAQRRLFKARKGLLCFSALTRFFLQNRLYASWSADSALRGARLRHELLLQAT